MGTMGKQSTTLQVHGVVSTDLETTTVRRIEAAMHKDSQPFAIQYPVAATSTLYTDQRGILHWLTHP